MLDQVASRVWVATSATWSTTSTIVVAQDGAALVVDPALTPEELTSLAREISERGWRVVAGFSTHPHWDHVLWSAALPDVRDTSVRRLVSGLRWHEVDVDAGHLGDVDTWEDVQAWARRVAHDDVTGSC